MKTIYDFKDHKKNQLERLLQNGTVMIFIDSRYEGVQVPDEFTGNPQLALNLDYAFQIPDFKILDDRVEVTLEFFGSMNFFCILPFDSIYALKSDMTQEAVFFPEDVPADFIVQKPPPKAETPKEKTAGRKKEIPKKGRPKLVAVSGSKGKKKSGKKAAKKTKKAKKKPAKKKKGSHLKLVK